MKFSTVWEEPRFQEVVDLVQRPSLVTTRRFYRLQGPDGGAAADCLDQRRRLDCLSVVLMRADNLIGGECVFLFFFFFLNEVT